MPEIPTCLVKSIGAYTLFEPIVVESAAVGRPDGKLALGGGFGSIGANLYRASHHLLTLALALRNGTVETRYRGDELPGDFLPDLFGIACEGDSIERKPVEFTAATVVILGEKLPGGSRKGAVICGPDRLELTGEGKWRITGGNRMMDEVVPATGSVIPTEQRIFYNIGLPMKTIPDAGEAAGIWHERCGFGEEFSMHLAKTLRWEIPEDGEGLALPVFAGTGFRLMFPDGETRGFELADSIPGDSPPARLYGTSLPNLLPYEKKGF